MPNYPLSINNYQLPEGYKQTEVGVIPEDWDVKATGEICEFIVPGRNKPKSFKGNIPWITTPDLEDGRSVSVSKVGLFVSREEAKFVGSKIVPKGSVLMSCVGELGIVALVEREIVINQQLHAFIPTEKIDAFFLLNALQSQKDYMLSIATITAVPYLNKDNCNSILIPLPSLPEQQAIAATLSDVDALIASLDKLIAKQRHLKTATMQQLLTGKKRLPGFGEGKGYKQTEVGVIPEDWEPLRFGDVVSFSGGSQPPRSTFIFKPKEGYIRLIQIRDYKTDAYATYIPEVLAKKKCTRDDVMIGRYGPPIFQILRGIEGAYNVALMKAIPSDRINREFLYHFIQNDDLFKLVEMLSQRSSGQTGVELPALRNYPLALPSEKEQRAIAAVLSDMDAVISALETRRAKTQAIKQGMMQQLLTGQVRLTVDSASQ